MISAPPQRFTTFAQAFPAISTIPACSKTNSMDLSFECYCVGGTYVLD